MPISDGKKEKKEKTETEKAFVKDAKFYYD